MNFTAVIPARYASTRLPAKALLDLGGKPMVVRVAERARASGAARVIVATDDERIAGACAAHGVEAMMTRVDHASGTDRIAEVALSLSLADEALIVNVQGDEPLIPPMLVAGVAKLLGAAPEAAIATACHRIHDAAEFANPNVVKVVLGKSHDCLYFSRAPIPWPRDAFANGIGQLPDSLPVYRHVGIYAYRVGFLRAFTSLAPAPIEQFEALEQLRALWHGYRIRALVIDEAPPAGVDTAEDAARVARLFD